MTGNDAGTTWRAATPFDRVAAVAEQRRLAEQVERETRLGPVSLIAGVDCSAPRFASLIRAAVVLMSWPTLSIVEEQRAEVVTQLPYMPGLLSFRELPAILAAWQQLTSTPDLVMVDGQGIAHPRRLGIAAHLGVLLNLPTVGVAKSILCGKPQAPGVGPEAGDQCELMDRGECIGILLRTRHRSNPLVISTGHRISLADSVSWVIACGRGYRLPEPTRQAHLLAGRRDIA